MSVENKSPATAGAVTDSKGKYLTHSPYEYNYTSEHDFCQAMLAGILELSDDIINSCEINNETASWAGEIKGRAYAIKAALGV